jgi:hypothetical protein
MSLFRQTCDRGKRCFLQIEPLEERLQPSQVFIPHGPPTPPRTSPTAALVGSVLLSSTSHLTGTDTVTAGTGYDSFIAGHGYDTVVPGTGFDSFKAGHGNDAVVLSHGPDLIFGSAIDGQTFQVAPAAAKGP